MRNPNRFLGILLMACANDSMQPASAQNCGIWKPVGDGMASSGDAGYVWSMAIFNGDLLAGGDLPTSMNNNGVAKWNGKFWQPMGSIATAVGSYVSSLVVLNDELYAGGNFSSFPEEGPSYIARWDGGAWQPVGEGVNGYVSALGVFDGQVIVSGNFTIAGGQPASRIAAWDGSQWSPLGAGLNAPAYAFQVYGKELVACGGFTSADGSPASRIAAWNGTQWRPFGTGLNSIATTMVVHNGDLFVGGWFTTAGGQSAKRVARWNGTNWFPLGDGMDEVCGSGGGPYVWSMLVFGDKVVAVGNYCQVDGQIAAHVAGWDGKSWMPIGYGMALNTSLSYSTIAFDGELIVGGRTNPDTGIGDPYLYVIRLAPCPNCSVDIAPSGWIDIDDLLAVVNEWGPCPADPAVCNADITSDDQVNIDDLLAVINAWGPCE